MPSGRRPRPAASSPATAGAAAAAAAARLWRRPVQASTAAVSRDRPRPADPSSAAGTPLHARAGAQRRILTERVTKRRNGWKRIVKQWFVEKIVWKCVQFVLPLNPSLQQRTPTPHWPAAGDWDFPALVRLQLFVRILRYDTTPCQLKNNIHPKLEIVHVRFLAGLTVIPLQI